MPTVVAIAGSLRRASANHLVIRAAQRIAGESLRIDGLEVLQHLPHFNPDLDEGAPPPPVLELRRRVGEADALMISSPEYAHGVPGSLKNALDWLVSCVEFPGKPVLLLNVSAGDAQHAQGQLVEILTTMSARVITRPPLVSAAVRRIVSADGEISDAQLRATLKGALAELQRTIESAPPADQRR